MPSLSLSYLLYALLFSPLFHQISFPFLIFSLSSLTPVSLSQISTLSSTLSTPSYIHSTNLCILDFQIYPTFTSPLPHPYPTFIPPLPHIYPTSTPTSTQLYPTSTYLYTTSIFTPPLPHPTSTTPLPHFYPTSFSPLHYIYLYPTPTKPLLHLYPTSTPPLPHLYPTSTPPIPHFYPTSTQPLHNLYLYPTSTTPLPNPYPTSNPPFPRQVWCALTHEGRLVAVKQIPLDILNMRQAEREYHVIQDEVDLLKTMKHRNIVGLVWEFRYLANS